MVSGRRSAYNESVLLGQALTKKMNEDPTDRQRDGPASDDEDEVDVSTSRKFAQAVNASLEDDSGRPSGDSGKYGKLLNMDFMKAAAAKQKEKALEEAQTVLRQLRELEHEAPSDDDEAANRVRNAPFKAADAAPLSLAQRSNKEDVQRARQNVDKLMGSSFNLSTSSKFSMPAATVVSQSNNDSDAVWKDSSEPVESMEANPWLTGPQTTTTGSTSRTGGKKVSTASKELEKTVFVKQAVSTLNTASKSAVAPPNNEGDKSKPSKSAKSGAGGAAKSAANTAASTSQADTTQSQPKKFAAVESGSRKPLLHQKTQNDLVQLAFAGPDLEKEFNKFKDTSIEDEFGIDKAKSKIISDGKKCRQVNY